ncbi:MAG: ATP-binding protein [Candidatus Hatepunaea meridiana]|nr:ATP-binding protein [Candidatus Hatepunaea meridiana]
MELQFGPEIIGSYRRLSYNHWYALAEFVDNSTQAYFNNREELDREFEKADEKLTVRIEYSNDGQNSVLRIIDNSIGMSESELENAVTLGKPPLDTSGRSKYGLGMKTAACWFGNMWRIETKKLNEDNIHSVQFNIPEIIKGKRDLNFGSILSDSKSEHYTIIEIKSLHQNFYGRTIGKVKDYLRSMYRIDLVDYELQLYWQNELLSWDWDEQIYDRLIVNADGTKAKRDFEFLVGGKKVFGWAGVLRDGSRANAGFSIIQANRVIKGWPDSYRPETIFGPQAGGSNDLINQRFVGMLYLDGFEVSHTKDQIMFSEDEKEYLEAELLKEFGDFRSLAKSYRKLGADERVSSNVLFESAINEFQSELESNEIKDVLFTSEVPPNSLIKKVNKSIKEEIMDRVESTFSVKINELEVKLYAVNDMSPNDPYVIIESTEKMERVIIIVNKAHPHWVYLNNQESITNFLRHCTYDGVAEWKACFIVRRLDPDTIKLIKDNLLRLPFEIEKHSN